MRNPLKKAKKESWQLRFGQPFARPSWVVGGVHRQSRGHGSACTRTHFSGLRFGTPYESGIKIKEAQCVYSLPKRPKLRDLLANQDYDCSLQKTHWRSSTSSRKVWWLDNGWSQSPQRGWWMKRQSPIRCRGSRSCHSMDTIVSVQDKDFTRDGRECTKVPRAVAKKHKWSIQTIHWNLENLVKMFHGIIQRQHLIDPKRMASLKEPFDE